MIRVIPRAIKRALAVLTTSLSLQAAAGPLGIQYIIHQERPKLELQFQSDLWTSPNQNKRNPIRVYEIAFISPIYYSESWEVGFHAGTEGLRIGNAGLSVGEHQIDIGGDLRSQSLGVSIENKGPEKRETALLLKYGSESDVPFQKARDVAVDVILYHRFSQVGNWQNIVGLDFTKNRGYYDNLVIPLIGASYSPSENFRMYFGFPFLRFDWVMDQAQTSFMATPVEVEATRSHRFNDFLTGFFRVGILNRSYMPSLRIEEDRRVIFEEKYSEVSALRRVSPKTTIESTFGVSVDRKLYEAKSVYAPIGEVVTVRSDIYGNLKMGFEF